ncbi:MAG: TIGR02680 family protein, partial [Mycobacteriales bacterium]
MTDLRPGEDFSLIAGHRVIDQKELKKLDGIKVPNNASAYRARLAGDLFGLDAEAYDNLTELLKQLRKPKLGERLNPTVLAQTLRDALPPLATNEIDQLADGWDHLEQLRTAVEETEKAAVAVANFVRSGWKPWARAVVRRRADEFASATTKLDDTTRDKNAAEKSLADHHAKAESAQTELENTAREREDRGAELREILESPAYRSARDAARRVVELKNQIDAIVGHSAAADIRKQEATRSVANSERKVDEAAHLVADSEDIVRRRERQLIERAGPAGLADAVTRHLPD